MHVNTPVQTNGQHMVCIRSLHPQTILVRRFVRGDLISVFWGDPFGWLREHGLLCFARLALFSLSLSAVGSNVEARHEWLQTFEDFFLEIRQTRLSTANYRANHRAAIRAG